jgi:hypothetical protein
LADYQVKSCVSHAEDVRIVKSELFCDSCRELTGVYAYLAVQRGILIGVADSLPLAQTLLADMNLEKLILWYHDLCQRHEKVVGQEDRMRGFLRDIIMWFEHGPHHVSKDDEQSVPVASFLLDRQYLEGAEGPLEAIKRFLEDEQGD